MAGEGALRRTRLDAALLYLVTPGEPRGGGLDEFLPRVLEAGVDMVQLREKGLEARPLLRLAAVARRRTSEFGALFIVNDRVDLALAAEADGVHVGQEDIPPGEARRQMGPEVLIGLSTHSEEQVLVASPEADYIAVGPVLPTPTKPGRPPVGPGLVRFAAGRPGRRPFFAIGGVDLLSLPAVLEAGARRGAVGRALTGGDDPPPPAPPLGGGPPPGPLPPQDQAGAEGGPGPAGRRTGVPPAPPRAPGWVGAPPVADEADAVARRRPRGFVVDGRRRVADPGVCRSVGRHEMDLARGGPNQARVGDLGAVRRPRLDGRAAV